VKNASIIYIKFSSSDKKYDPKISGNRMLFIGVYSSKSHLAISFLF